MNRPATAVAQAIRPFTPADIPQVAALYRRVFLRGTTTAPNHSPTTQTIAQAFAEIFFDNPWYDEEIPSLIYTDAGDSVVGFLGVTTRRMLFKQQPIRLAVSAHLMTQPGSQNPLAGLQLLKTFFNGPQDLSLTDGANNAGRKVWEGLGGLTVPAYSFSWQRVLRPSAYTLAHAAGKLSWLSSLGVLTKPLCRAGDAYLTRLMPYRFQFSPPQATADKLDVQTMLDGIAECAAGDLLRPDYDEAALAWLLARAQRIKSAGSLQQIALRNARRELLGWYLYYLRPSGESPVLQLAARRNAFTEVFDHLCQHAWQRGAVSLSGRVEPKYLPLLTERHCAFTSGNPWLQAHSHDPELLQAILSGNAFLTSLEGEWCTSYRSM